MKTFRGSLKSLRETVPPGPHVMTIGNFDGIHAGHQFLLRRLLDISHKKHLPSLLLTFDPHPLFFLSPETPFRMIMSPDQKEEVLSGLGLDILVVLAFDKDVQLLSPEDFSLSVLWDLFHPAALIVGEGFRFGHGRSGSIEDLRRVLSPLGVEVSSLPPFEEKGLRVSSSRIRKAVDQGDIEEANRLLTRPIEVSGPVSTGEKRGQLLGFPTLNLIPPDHRLIPPPGVYATRTQIGGSYYDGATYIGTKPTFGTHHPVVETHLFDFDRDCYGKWHRVFFYHRIRGERSFASVDALKLQITADVAEARQVLHDHPFTGSVGPL